MTTRLTNPMTDKQQIDQLADSLDALIDRARDEYDMSYASVIGVLQMKIHALLHEAEDEAEDRDE